MPLSAQEKNQISQGLEFVGKPAVDLFAAAFAPAPPDRSALETLGRVIFDVRTVFGIGNRQRSPKISPFDLGRAAQAGLRGFRLTSDPFFGDIVISRPEQAPFLDELVRSSAERRILATQDFSGLFDVRQGVIEGLAETAVERGFAREIDPALRGGVIRETENAPLQFVEGNFLP